MNSSLFFPHCFRGYDQPLKKRWQNFIDAFLHLFLSPQAVKQVWRSIYRYRLGKTLGILLGAMLLLFIFTDGAFAQLGSDAQDAIDSDFSPYLGSFGNFVAVIFGALRLFVYFAAGGVIIWAIIDSLTNKAGQMSAWAAAAGIIVLAYVLFNMTEDLIFS